MDDNLIKQAEEVEALSAIYGDDWTTESDVSKSYNIRIVEGKKEAILYVTMPPEYPGQAPPKYELSAPWMNRKAKEKLHSALDDVCLENKGETVIFQWVEKIREILQSMKSPETEKKPQQPVIDEENLDFSKLEINCPEITHGEVIVDRKSSFQGHAAQVNSIEDVHAVLTKLKQNKKILHATHNMYAYRIERKTDKGTSILQDCDDDGETHAGGRMLHLMQILDQKNALVVVSRWFSNKGLKMRRNGSGKGWYGSVCFARDLAGALPCPQILHATHNMYAYRIERKTDKGTSILQDCDDDGETHAGGRMLHLMQILDQKNALVVVSRWYGGIQLGPDRFRHINNATRQVLQQAGLLKSK